VEAASLLPIVAIALLFWLLLIRPASKRQKDLTRMQSALRPGDQVMLGAGIFATVVGLDDEAARVHVEVAPGTRLEVARGAIAQVLEQAAPADQLDDTDSDQPDGPTGDQGPRGDS
jgi:preprotein translocase subunit YajC